VEVLLLIKKKIVMTKERDYVAEIMNKWYHAMEANKVAVQPKASTILGTILADYTISHGTPARDIWAEALQVKGGEFAGWYASLSKEEKLQYDAGRQKASENFDPRDRKQLLKG
jgi:hypothetical protein